MAGQPEEERRTPDNHPSESSGQGSSVAMDLFLSVSLDTGVDGTEARRGAEARENANRSPRKLSGPDKKTNQLIGQEKKRKHKSRNRERTAHKTDESQKISSG